MPVRGAINTKDRDQVKALIFIFLARLIDHKETCKYANGNHCVYNLSQILMNPLNKIYRFFAIKHSINIIIIIIIKLKK